MVHPPPLTRDAPPYRAATEVSTTALRERATASVGQLATTATTLRLREARGGHRVTEMGGAPRATTSRGPATTDGGLEVGTVPPMEVKVRGDLAIVVGSGLVRIIVKTLGGVPVVSRIRINFDVMLHDHIHVGGTKNNCWLMPQCCMPCA